jgi:stage II sporulation protein AA (anti-sigma F factor antagonist)
MYIRSFLQDKQMTITLSGEIDHHEAKHAMKTMTEKIDAYLPRICTLDFRDVSFMDSSGIAIVIAGVRRMREIGGKLTLSNVPEQPMKVLLAAGIDQIAEIKGVKQK